MENKLTQLPDTKLPKELKLPPAIQLDAPSLAQGQLGEIQEILFGQQLRSHTEQLASVHAYYSGLITQLAENHQQQLQELQNQVDRASQETEDRFSAQRRDQDSKLTDMNNQMRTMEAGFASKIGNSSERQATAYKQLESELHQIQNQLSEKITSTRDDVLTQLQSKSTDLQSSKVDRDVLAELLTRLTTELSGNSNGMAAENRESTASAGVIRVEK